MAAVVGVRRLGMTREDSGEIVVHDSRFPERLAAADQQRVPALDTLTIGMAFEDGDLLFLLKDRLGTGQILVRLKEMVIGNGVAAAESVQQDRAVRPEVGQELVAF